jgi:Tfp pilus assembly protein PilF
MIDLYHNSKKKLIVISIFSTLLLLEGCDKEEDSKEHLQKGVEYLNKGEYEKAKLEIKSASQSGKETEGKLNKNY